MSKTRFYINIKVSYFPHDKICTLKYKVAPLVYAIKDMSFHAQSYTTLTSIRRNIGTAINERSI